MGPSVVCVKGWMGFPNSHNILICVLQAAFKKRRLVNFGVQTAGNEDCHCGWKGTGFLSAGRERFMTAPQQPSIIEWN